MNYNATYKRITLVLACFIVMMATMVNQAAAQTNLASFTQGTVCTQSGGGVGVNSYNVTAPPPMGYGPTHYNNDTLTTVGWTAPPPNPPNPPSWQDVGYVLTNGWIEMTFTSNVTFNKVVFYKDTRPMTNCTIQYWNGTSYVDIVNYVNYDAIEQDSITFTPTTSNKIRFNNITSVNSSGNNPTFREIKVFGPPTAACTGAPTVSAASVTLVPNAGTPASLQPNYATSLNPCIGSLVTLSAYNLPNASGLSYQWKKGGSPIAGATNSTYQFYAYSSATYTVTVTCGATSATSNTVTVTVPSPVYASLPYFQGFESAWVSSSCVTAPIARDLPAATSWSSYPSSGNSSWRIDTAGAFASGWTGISSSYSPAGIGAATPQRYARFHTSGALLYNPGNLELYINCTGAGNKALYFYQRNQGNNTNDSLVIYLSTDGGDNFTRVAGWDTASASATSNWVKRWVSIPSTSPNTIIRFQAVRIGNDNTDIGIDSIYIAAGCSGTPVAGNINLASPVNSCPGARFTLSTVGTTQAGDLYYQWESSTDGATFTPVSNCGSGSDGLAFTTPPLYDTIYYRMGVKCGTGGVFVYTNNIKINVARVKYQPLPYTQSFDGTWFSLPGSSCGTRPLPDSNFANQPTTGNISWRRDDDGAAGAWTNTANGIYSPVGVTGVTGDHSARFHSAQVALGVAGNMDILLDCSGATGTKDLSFAYINTGGNDSLQILYSSDAGCSFNLLTTFYLAANWTFYTVPVPSNSAKTVIRFRAVGDFTASDIGIDSVRIVPPCTGQPNPGTISATPPCSNVSFTMGISGYTQAASITYQWYESLNGNAGTYTAITGATTVTYTTAITVPHYYYVVLTCNNTATTDTTPVKYVPLASFYNCYCASFATSASGSDVGNFNVKSIASSLPVINMGTAAPLTYNGSAVQTYTDNKNITPIPILYLDSTYILSVTQTNSGAFNASTVTVWIDTNHNGAFDAGERFMFRTTSATSNPAQNVKDTFTMLPTAVTGITGLRVVLEQGYPSPPAPCGGYTNGETEDYLIDIRYAPCDGPASAGTAVISDTASCVGYNITVSDTSHEKKKSGLQWVWQYSPDGNSWSDVSGSVGKDTITQIITGPVFFRMRMLCLNTLDTTFSNVVSVSVNPPVSCYCFSQAIGGIDGDSSDIGAFFMDNIAINVGGPHVKNPQAYQMRTDYTRIATPQLWVDSSYAISIYHIMRSDLHADAKITLFIDWNANLKYDIPQELVWTTYTTAGQFTVDTVIKIPSNAIPNVKTGMRVILNNDVFPNVPSDSACGTYASGETEDYVVMFRTLITDVNNVRNVSWLEVYPNPNEGKFTVSYGAVKNIAKTSITVTNVTGQKIRSYEYKDTGKEFNKEIDLTGMPRGVYFVELKADSEKLVRKMIVK